MTPLLALDRIVKIYGTPQSFVAALDDLSYGVAENSFVSLVGPSGCGKTTILRIVAGLTFPTSGLALLRGDPIRGPGADRGMVFQSYTSFPWLTVKANIEFGPAVRGAARSTRDVAARDLIELTGLSGFENAYPHTLSGGMKQRVALARTLANDPAILIMDEPFGSLDQQTRWTMQELLLTIWDRSQKTVLFVTHDIEEALFLSDVVLVLTARPGRIKREIPVHFPRPRCPELKATPEFVALKAAVIGLIREELSTPSPSQHVPHA